MRLYSSVLGPLTPEKITGEDTEVERRRRRRRRRQSSILLQAIGCALQLYSRSISQPVSQSVSQQSIKAAYQILKTLTHAIATSSLSPCNITHITRPFTAFVGRHSLPSKQAIQNTQKVRHGCIQNMHTLHTCIQFVYTVYSIQYTS